MKPYLILGSILLLVISCKIENDKQEVTTKLQFKITKGILSGKLHLITDISKDTDSLGVFYALTSAEASAVKGKMEEILSAGANKEACEANSSQASKIGFNAYYEDLGEGRKRFIYGYRHNDKGMHVSWDEKRKTESYFLNKNKVFNPFDTEGAALEISRKQIQEMLDQFPNLEIDRNQMVK